jgi:diacylglycerol kinase (ATP)
MKEHYLIICNPLSGKGKAAAILPSFEDFLRSKEISFETFLGDYPKQLESYSCLVIMGGDGTINYVLNHYREINIPIAFIIGGTGNDYASLHVKNASIQDQFEIAIQAQNTLVDAGICNNKLFINGVGIGFDGWVVKRNIGKRFFTGITAYYSTIISLLLFYKESEISITIGNKQWKQNAFMLSIAKGKTYGGGFRVAPEAHPSNGALDCIIIGKIGLLNRFRYLPVIEKGKHLALPFVHYEKSNEIIHIEANHSLQAHLDGEWMENKVFTIQLLPQYFKIKSRL